MVTSSEHPLVCAHQEWRQNPRRPQWWRAPSRWAWGTKGSRAARELRSQWGSALPPPQELPAWRRLATTYGRRPPVRKHLEVPLMVVCFVCVCFRRFSAVSFLPKWTKVWQIPVNCQYVHIACMKGFYLIKLVLAFSQCDAIYTDKIEKHYIA